MVAVVFDPYDVGGSFSVTPGFFRMVKKPTAIGIRIRISEKHTIPKPVLEGNWASLKVPCPAAVSAPNRHINKPGHPQSTTAAMVAIIPVFLLFIKILLFLFAALYQLLNFAPTSFSNLFTIFVRIAAASASVIVFSD